LIENSQQFGENCQKTAGGIFLTHTLYVPRSMPGGMESSVDLGAHDYAPARNRSLDRKSDAVTAAPPRHNMFISSADS